MVSENLADSIVIVMGVCIKMREKDRNSLNWRDDVGALGVCGAVFLENPSLLR